MFAASAASITIWPRLRVLLIGVLRKTSRIGPGAAVSDAATCEPSAAYVRSKSTNGPACTATAYAPPGMRWGPPSMGTYAVTSPAASVKNSSP
jgi:hypothetical protein